MKRKFCVFYVRYNEANPTLFVFEVSSVDCNQFQGFTEHLKAYKTTKRKEENFFDRKKDG